MRSLEIDDRVPSMSEGGRSEKWRIRLWKATAASHYWSTRAPSTAVQQKNVNNIFLKEKYSMQKVKTCCLKRILIITKQYAKGKNVLFKKNFNNHKTVISRMNMHRIF